MNQKKTPPLQAASSSTTCSGNRSLELFLNQFWTKPILTICAFLADARTLANTP